ncbi:MAG: L-lactate permease [Syntrophales bacterium]|nr:L-lactate permease [Syntrophales bacterium]MDD5533872.1 L-lactate permease [Syntrophales bacterium]
MPGSNIAVSLFLWIVAIVPLAAILFLLVGLRWQAASAAPAGYFLAMGAAFLFFETSAWNMALQTVKGLWDAVFILYVIVPALLLYQISKEGGAFRSLRIGIEAYTPNNLLHILAFGWVFASFLQGITGFGAPIAVTAPLLVAVGVKPLWAVIIPLIGHSWANTFGTLAVAWEGLRLAADIPDPMFTAGLAAGMLFIPNLLAGFSIAWLYGRKAGLKEALPAVLIISGIHGIGQLALAPFIPTLAGFVPATAAVFAVIGLARTRWYRGDSAVEQSPVMREEDQKDLGRALEEEALGEGGRREEMPLSTALAPYLVLIVLIVGVLLVPPVRDSLESFQVGLPFPRLETGMGVVTEAKEAYSAFSPLTHPGTFLLASALIAFLLFKLRGHIPGMRIDDILVNTVKTSIPSAMALFALIPLAKVMEGSGQIMVLALGIANVASGTAYAFTAPFIGSLGAFMTSSNLSSNILFGPLQKSTAEALFIPTSVSLASQTAGAAIGNSIAPGNVLLGTGAVGIPGQEGSVIRRTLVFMMISVALAGLIAVIVFYMGAPQ